MKCEFSQTRNKDEMVVRLNIQEISKSKSFQYLWINIFLKIEKLKNM